MHRPHPLSLPVVALGALLFAPAILLRGGETDSSASTPSRIILTWAGDPSRTQAVTWRTESPVLSPQAQIAKLDPDPAFEKTAATVTGTTLGFKYDFAPGR